MAVWGYDQAATLAAMPLYRPEPVVPPSWSAWSLVTAVPRGIGEAAHQVVGSTADLAKAYRFFRDATPQQLRAGVPVEQYSSDFGDYVRDRGRELRPDPASASAAEQVLYGFARGAAKIVGAAVVAGPAGVVAAGLEEGMSQSDELRRQGVGVEPRTRAGVVQGAGLALAALPAFGATWGQTAALYVAGGPGGYVAQQAMTREILRTAGHERVAEQFDPLDPVGLAVASLLPAGFAWLGMRGQKLAAAAQSLPDLPRADAGAPAPDAAPFPSEPTAIARAIDKRFGDQHALYPDEVVDAARVAYQAEVRSASDPGAGGMRTADAHEAALSRAEDQIARGDAVSVADVAPVPERFVTVWHGSPHLFDRFDSTKIGTGEGAQAYGHGLYLAESPDVAETYSPMVPARYITRDGGDFKPRSGYEDAMLTLVSQYGTAAKALDAMGPNVPDGVRQALEAMIAEGVEVQPARRAAVYKVDLPESAIARMLDWDKPLSQQAPSVKAALQKAGIATDEQALGAFDDALLAALNGGPATLPKQPLNLAGETVYRRLGGPDVAAEKLRALGIPGIRYLDGGSRADGQGTYNYVIFPGEEGMLRITERNGQPLETFARNLSESVEALRKAEGVEAPKPAAPITTAQLDDFFARTKLHQPAAAPDVDAVSPARVAEVAAQFPDLMVRADDMDAPMRLADFLEAAKAEADEFAADADLMKIAAECALTTGMG